MKLSRAVPRALEVGRFLYAQRTGRLTVPNTPHMDEASTPEFIALLRASSFYLEFGSGGSTLEAGRLGVETISVDSDRFFAEAVRNRLAADANITQINVDIGVTEAWGIPIAKRPTATRIKRWRRYLDAPFAEIARRGRFPDLVLIDGRFRAACALQTAKQARMRRAATVIFIDDYIDRPEYHGAEMHLGSPQRVGRAAIFRPVAGWASIKEADIVEAAKDYR